MKKIYSGLFFILTIQAVFAQSGWQPLNSGTTNGLLSVQFVNSSTGYVCGAGGIIIKTTNDGASWVALTSGVNSALRAMYFVNANLGYVAGDLGLVVKTTNAGVTWTAYSAGTGGDQLSSIHFLDEFTGFVAGLQQEAILRTTNGGVNWTMLNAPSGSPLYLGVYFMNFNTGVICGGGGIIQRTTNAGAGWTTVMSPSGAPLLAVQFPSVNTGYTVGQGGKIFKSVNNGLNWTNISVSSFNFLNSLYFLNDNTGYVVGDSNGVTGKILQTTNGNTWNRQYDSSGTFLQDVWMVNSSTGYAVGYNGLILKTTNGGNPIGITSISNEVPSEYRLYQNYPNPFNPKTIIRYSLIVNGHVSLKVYDILGSEMSILVNEKLQPGMYEVEWDATNFPSGVYYYRLTAGEYAETRKMVVIK